VLVRSLRLRTSTSHTGVFRTLMNVANQDREEPVTLSAAKNLPSQADILRCAQNDISDFDH